MEAQDDEENDADKGLIAELRSLMKFFYINTVPSYGNNFFFTIGIYLLELFGILAVTGIIMLVFGPYWWDLSAAGTFVRTVHLWAAEAFVLLMFLHFFVNFSTSAFRKKRLAWMIGGIMLLAVLLEFAFGIGGVGGLISQYNAKAGADLWNGLGLGYWINPLNAGAVIGWHAAILPIILAALMFVHFMLVKTKGLNTPYRSDIKYSIVQANHRTMFKRMGYILVAVVVFSILFRAPYEAPLTIGNIANSYPDLTAITLLNEFNGSSNTATYLDTIDPYTFSTRAVYVTEPYKVYTNITHTKNYEADFLAENGSMQKNVLSQAFAYFDNNGSVAEGVNSSNPLVAMASGLTEMAQKGVYQPIVQSEAQSGLDTTYVLLFINDTGMLNVEGERYGLSLQQWGMLSVGGSPPLDIQFWLIPYNLLELMTAGIPWWGDLENGIVGFVAFMVIVFLPFIPGLNKLPDKLRLYKLFWNRFTVPEMRKGKGKDK